MVTKEEKRHLRYSDYFVTATFVGVIVLLVTIFSSVIYVKNISQQVIKNQKHIEYILNNISEKNSSITNKINDNYDNYNDFIKNYYAVQANWLNTWLTALAIIMAILGIMIPICFIKFLENKEKEMDRIIQEAREQKTKTKVNVREMAKQLKEVDEKSNKMTNELNEVKDYVLTVKAEAIYVDAVNKFNASEFDKALELLHDAKDTKNSDKISYLIGECYRCTNKLRSAINAYDEAINLNPKIQIYYTCKADCLNRIGDYSNALSAIEKAIVLDKDNIHTRLQKINILVNSNKETYKQSARSFVQQNYEKYKNNPALLNKFGFLLIKAGYDKEAENLLLCSIKIDKQPYFQYYNLTKIYIKLGKYLDAKSTLQQYLSEDSKRMHLGIYDDNYNEWVDKLTSVEQELIVKDILAVLKTVKIKKRSGDEK